MHRKLIKQLLSAGFNVPNAAALMIKRYVNQPKYIIMYDRVPCGLVARPLGGKKPPKEGILDHSKITVFWGRKAADDAIQRTIYFYAGKGPSDTERYDVVKATEA